MFRRKIPIKKYFALTSMFVFLMGFFVYALHLTPQLFHHVADADANTEHSNKQIIGVDHHGSMLFSSREEGHVELVVAIVPLASIEIVPTADTTTNFSEYATLDDPPNKTPLYIKNNTFII